MKRKVYKAVSFADLEKVGLTFELSQNSGGDLKVTKIHKDGVQAPISRLKSVLRVFVISPDHKVGVTPKQAHRCSQGLLVNTHRFLGTERQDKDWLKSGFASDEAKLASSKMKDMVSQTQKLYGGKS